jgi:hypothetical protein
MNGSQEVLMTLRLRLRGLSVALAISAILGTGMLVSACAWSPAPAKTERATYAPGYNTDPMGAPSVRTYPIQRS